MQKVSKYFQWIGVVIALGPVGIALISIPFSFIFVCTSGGGAIETCVVGGSGMGKFIYTLAMMHWFTLVTFIPGLIIFGLGLLIELFVKIRESKILR